MRHHIRPERLAQVIQAYQEALRSHPEEQDTHGAILSLLEGDAAGEITASRLAYACCAIKRRALLMRPLPPGSTARQRRTWNASSAGSARLVHSTGKTTVRPPDLPAVRRTPTRRHLMPDLRPVVPDARVLELLQERFAPSATDLVPVEGGSVARTFAFRSGEEAYIIRFNLDRMLRSNFPKEAYLWQKLSSTSIPMPPVLQVGRLGDLQYAISRKMPGKTLSQSTPHELEQLFPQILATLHALHQVDVRNTDGYGVFDEEGRGMASSWHTFLQAIAEEELEHDYYGKWHRLFEETFLERTVFDRVHQQVLRLLPSCPEERFLVHGNPGLGNLLAQDGTLAAVLDWLDARYGDFVYDIAYLDYWLPGLRVRERFGRFYQERGIHVPAYAERILCYQCYVTLDAMRFYAKSGQEQGYTWVCSRILEQLS